MLVVVDDRHGVGGPRHARGGHLAEPDSYNPVLELRPDGASLIFDGLVARDAANRWSRPWPTRPGGVGGRQDRDREPARRGDVPRRHAADRPGRGLHLPGRCWTRRSTRRCAPTWTCWSRCRPPTRPPWCSTSSTRTRRSCSASPLGIVPAKQLRGQDINKAPFNRNRSAPARTVFESWTPGDRLVLAANELLGRQAATATWSWRSSPTTTSAPSGCGPASSTPPSCRRSWPPASTSTPAYQVQRCRPPTTAGVMLPMGNPVTGDPAIRRALTRRRPRRHGHRRARRRRRTGVRAGPPPTSEFADPSIYGKPTADPAAAAATLDAAGWTAGAGGIRAKDGQQAAFTLMYPATDSLRKELALAVTADAKKVGIEVKPEGLTWDAIDPADEDRRADHGLGHPVRPGLRLLQAVRLAVRRAGLLQPRPLQLAGRRRRPAGRPRPAPTRPHARPRTRPSRSSSPPTCPGCSSPTCSTPTWSETTSRGRRRGSRRTSTTWPTAIWWNITPGPGVTRPTSTPAAVAGGAGRGRSAGAGSRSPSPALRPADPVLMPSLGMFAARRRLADRPGQAVRGRRRVHRHPGEPRPDPRQLGRRRPAAGAVPALARQPAAGRPRLVDDAARAGHRGDRRPGRLDAAAGRHHPRRGAGRQPAARARWPRTGGVAVRPRAAGRRVRGRVHAGVLARPGRDRRVRAALGWLPAGGLDRRHRHQHLSATSPTTWSCRWRAGHLAGAVVRAVRPRLGRREPARRPRPRRPRPRAARPDRAVRARAAHRAAAVPHPDRHPPARDWSAGRSWSRRSSRCPASARSACRPRWAATSRCSPRSP